MKFTYPIPLALLGACLITPLAFSQTTTTFQEGVSSYAGTADTNIYDDMPTKNFGANDQLFTRYNSNSGGSSGYDLAREGRNILLRFDDIESTLSGQTVTDASITLTLSTVAVGGGGDATAVIFAYELLQPWNEGVGTGSSGTTGTASWNDRLDATAWQTAGAQGSNDRDLTPFFTSNEFNIGGEGTVVVGDSMVIDLPTALVQSWIDSPSSNEGILISVATVNQFRYPVLGFYSSEYTSDLGDRPLLSVTSIPEPSSYVAFCALVAMLVCIRHKHKQGS